MFNAGELRKQALAFRNRAEEADERTAINLLMLATGYEARPDNPPGLARRGQRAILVRIEEGSGGALRYPRHAA